MNDSYHYSHFFIFFIVIFYVENHILKKNHNKTFSIPFYIYKILSSIICRIRHIFSLHFYNLLLQIEERD